MTLRNIMLIDICQKQIATDRMAAIIPYLESRNYYTETGNVEYLMFAN